MEDLAQSKPRLGARLRALFNLSAKVVGAVVLLLGAAGAALEFAPREAVRSWCVRELQDRLGRQVRLEKAAIGPWSGIRLEGLAISEAPDFSAGTFLETAQVSARLRLPALLSGRLSIDEALVVEPKLRVTKAGEALNVADLLAPRPATDPSLRAAQFFNGGWDDPQRKLGELGAIAAGALASAASRLSIEVRQLRVQRGELSYEDPAGGVRLAASGLSLWADGWAPRGARTELGVDCRMSGTLEQQPVDAEVALQARLELDARSYPVVSSGHVLLGKVRHPNFHTDRVRAEWDLRDLAPDLSSASGVVRLDGSAGELLQPASIARQGRWPGLLLYPVDVLAKFRGLGLKDLSAIPYSELRGEYSFQAGSINVAPFYVHGPLASVDAEGVLNLRQRTVGFKANVTMGRSSVGATIKGPMDAPVTEAALSFSGPKARHRTTHQTARDEPVDAERMLQPAFSDPDALLRQATEKQKRKVAARSRAQTMKDAESLIDAPLPAE